MAVQLISGSGSTLQDVDAASKAARATLYDSLGRELSPGVGAAGGAYILGFQVRHTTAAGAGVVVLNMRGPPSKTAYIRRIRGQVGFDGTALAASGTLRYGFFRGAGAAASSGGGSRQAPAATIGKKRTGYPNWTLGEFAYDLNGTGLTVAGITYEAAPFHVVTLPVVELQVAAPTTSADSGTLVPFDLQFHQPGERDDCFELAANDHFGIQLLTVAAIIGLTISGSVEFDEK